MTANQILHETVVIERTYDAPVARVFAAFADPEARVKWSAAGDDAWPRSARSRGLRQSKLIPFLVPQ